MNPGDRPTLLLVGGGGGLLGRALVAELAGRYRLRSLHPTASREEARVGGLTWVPGDAARVNDWRPLLDGVDVVVNVAWYRWESEARFRALAGGLGRLVTACADGPRPRFIQVSVPPAPERLEVGLPYLRWKREVDRAVSASGLDFAIVRPTLLFGRRDRLLGVMLGLMRRYPVFPMFGDGRYHLSPISVSDVARAIARLADDPRTGTFDLGGPVRYEYRELTDLMFRLLGKRPRYWRLSPQGGIRLARVLERLGSTLLYAYEVDWLVSDRLGPPPNAELGGTLERVEPYLEAEARALGRRPGPDPARS